MATIRITARGHYIVLVNDTELVADCNCLESAIKAAQGYQLSFGWEE